MSAISPTISAITPNAGVIAGARWRPLLARSGHAKLSLQKRLDEIGQTFPESA